MNETPLTPKVPTDPPTMDGMLASEKAQNRKPILHWSDLLLMERPPYLVKNLLTAGSMSVFYGEPGVMKSFVLLDIGMSIAAGMPWCGQQVKQGSVVYICGEGSHSIRERLIAWAIHHNVSINDMDFTGDSINPKDVPFYVIPSPVDLSSPKADLTPLITGLKAIPDVDPVVMVIIDTLSRVLSGGNENDSEDMGALVKCLDVLRMETKAHVACVHHAGKNVALGARGHSLLKAATDTEVFIQRQEDLIVLRATKQRDLALNFERRFDFKLIPTGNDEDNEIIKTPVLIPTDRLPSEGPTGQVLVVLNVLRETIRKEGQPATDVPGQPQAVLEARWRSLCLQKLGGSDSARRAFGRARKLLFERKAVEGNQKGWVWLNNPNEEFTFAL